jgi:exopolysaccharide biosynthesis polyprenyl glycosylphosphotransferase
VLPAHRVVAWVELKGERGAGEAPFSQEPGQPPVVKADDDEIAGVVARARNVGLVVIAPDDYLLARRLYPVLFRLRFEGVEVMLPQHVAEVYSGNVPLDMLNNELVMDASLETRFPMVSRVKRLMDIVLSSVLVVLFWPVALAIALLIKLSDWRSPVFYRQVRSGQFGVPFTILKFRTMRNMAEQGTGAVWSPQNDPRVTRIGRVLRRFRLDEAPQFVNVLHGEMSLVGPRPERPEIVEMLVDRIPFYAERMNVPPGLTGWAQIRYPYGNTIEDARRKLEYDLYYIKHLSLRLDLQILLSTLRIVVEGLPPVARAESRQAGNGDDSRESQSRRSGSVKGGEEPGSPQGE